MDCCEEEVKSVLQVFHSEMNFPKIDYERNTGIMKTRCLPRDGELTYKINSANLLCIHTDIKLCKLWLACFFK